MNLFANFTGSNLEDLFNNKPEETPARFVSPIVKLILQMFQNNFRARSLTQNTYLVQKFDRIDIQCPNFDDLQDGQNMLNGSGARSNDININSQSDMF